MPPLRIYIYIYIHRERERAREAYLSAQYGGVCVLVRDTPPNPLGVLHNNNYIVSNEEGTRFSIN